MPDREPDAWDLALGVGQIDALSFLKALARTPLNDFRSRLLRRDGLSALRELWGAATLRRRMNWLGIVLESPYIEPDFDNGRGFETLKRRVVDATKPEMILAFLRDVGSHLREDVSVSVGGAVALILRGLIVRDTDEIDAIEQNPTLLRFAHEGEPNLTDRHLLKINRGEPWYLPSRWRERTAAFDRFDRLSVRLVDPIDILCGKLFSRRTRDFVDLRTARALAGRELIGERLNRDGENLKTQETAGPVGLSNWYIMTGERQFP